jgi:NADPH:quinone reductase-like Zn-dependent oxidoreductase
MSTMKAIRIHEFGGPEVLRYEDVARPEPATGEVLVRVHAAGVIATDWQYRSGFMPGFLGLKLPVVPGWDIAGVVESTGLGAGGFQKGHPVYAMLPGRGGYAEFAAVPAAILAPKPARLTFAQAAAVPLAAMTAYKALYDAADLQAGQRALIHGAAGGVGSFAVQLARARGASVVASATRANAEFVRALGADEVVDYSAGPFEDQVREVDVVLDVIGRDTAQRSIRTLNPGGIIVTIAGEVPDAGALKAARARAVFVGTEPHGRTLHGITELIDAGKLWPQVDRVLPLYEADQAHRLLESHRVRGKVVLEVIPDA